MGVRGAILAGIAVLVLSVAPAAIMGYALAGVVHQLRNQQQQLNSVVRTIADLVGETTDRTRANGTRLDQAGGELGDLARQAETTDAKLRELLREIRLSSGTRQEALARLNQLSAQYASLQRRIAALEARQGQRGAQGPQGPPGAPGAPLPRTPEPTPVPAPCLPLLGPCASF